MFSKKAAAPTVETLERHSQFVDIWRRFKRNKLGCVRHGSGRLSDSDGCVRQFHRSL